MEVLSLCVIFVSVDATDELYGDLCLMSITFKLIFGKWCFLCIYL